MKPTISIKTIDQDSAPIECIPTGTCFMYAGNVFMKTDGSMYGAICLDDGSEHCFKGLTGVRLRIYQAQITLVPIVDGEAAL